MGEQLAKARGAEDGVLGAASGPAGDGMPAELRRPLSGQLVQRKEMRYERSSERSLPGNSVSETLGVFIKLMFDFPWTLDRQSSSYFIHFCCTDTMYNRTLHS